MRSKQLMTLLMLMFLIIATIIFIRNPGGDASIAPQIQQPNQGTADEPSKYPPQTSAKQQTDTAEQTAAGYHPISQLVDREEKAFEKQLQGQSQSLEKAVAEYKRRYQIYPPPNFDKWYEFAKQKKIKHIDDYDTIYHSLLPFWAVEPLTLRERTSEALGFDNALISISVRDGAVSNPGKNDEWLPKAIMGMMKGFAQHLPDMDLAFNMHDEPRVVIPHDDLARLIKKATDQMLPDAYDNPSPRKHWSPRPADLSDGTSLPEARLTRFNVFAHQPTWTSSRQSCPPDSPARSLEEKVADNVKSYAVSDIGFVGNKTAFTDICNSPSFRQTFGFFDRPNAFNIVHDIFPIFSQSKISSFQDILYPSPWYWADKVPYVQREDCKWTEKENKLYWRGSTTGGFSRNGGWRRQHRQQIVRNINGIDKSSILEATSHDGKVAWESKEVLKSEYNSLFDVHFSHIGQCDPGDCDAQKEAFELAPPANQEDAWKYKYLLDIDGNAFSGRFYAFLKSRSLVFKMAVFREWHDEWIRPWVHYIPLSLNGAEYVESIRHFDRDDDGKAEALKIVEAGREWAEQSLRNEDMEAWFFRLLLEYGRLVDDRRQSLGYST